ncbi:MAG: hypothetical protein ACR2KE_02100 [Candidatus Nanopelagicales bacterium]
MRSLPLAGVVAAAAVLAACSGGGSSPDSSTSASPVGGQAACDRPAIESVVKQDVNDTYPGATFVSLDDFSCEGGWAMAKAQVDTSGTTVPTVFFLRAEGQFWVPTSIEEICATPATQSTVPQSIYVAACGVQGS